ncbi:hypothetical protein Cni_G20265 [Canna indica]|uniref:Pectinesterase catalytic domain-containing protein n=1 Tax=Canna indica TaxID=4628 RepID=A0AAQ3KM74_9LILI|nr:hypothetical protein Cni_G20265 [Canna indica]
MAAREQDGSGDFKSIQAAVNPMLNKYDERYVIYVRASRYVNITMEKVNLLMYGDGQRKTMVSVNENYVDGFTAINTATFSKQNQATSSSSNQPQFLLLLLYFLYMYLIAPASALKHILIMKDGRD